MLIAGPPPKLNIITPEKPEQPDGGQPSNSNQAGSGTGPVPNPNRTAPPVDPDPDPDGDDDGDPLAGLLELDKSSLPIVGVATKVKGPSIRALYGLKRYEEWVFIFVPDQNFRIPPNPNQNQRNRGSNSGNIRLP
jgi:hypothetical protein